MDHKTTLRPFKIQDLEGIAGLWQYKAAIVDGEYFLTERNREKWLKSTLEKFKNKSGEIIVAECDGKIIGVIMCTIDGFNRPFSGYPPLIENKKIAWGSDWIVAPEYRGQGLGKRLFKELLKCLKSRGIEELRGFSRVYNIPSRKVTIDVGKSREEVVEAIKYLTEEESGVISTQDPKSSKVRVQKARGREVQLLLLLWERFNREGAVDRVEETKQNEKIWKKWLMEMITSEQGVVIVAELHNNIVGYCVATASEPRRLDTSSKTGRIFEIFVLTEYRRQTIGSVMLKTCLDYLHLQGSQAVRVMFRSHNVAAREFFRLKGFNDYNIRETSYPLLYQEG